MTPLFPSQRAAEEFENVLSGTADDGVAARYAELVGAVEQLRELPEVTPRADFVGDLRSRLMAAAEVELAPAPVRRKTVPSLPEERARRRHRRMGTIAASLVIVGGTAGMAAAASGALPGETLYPVKLGIEQVTTAVHFGDASQGKALLDQAATRLDEVRALQSQGTTDPDLMAATLDAFQSSADAGSKKLFASYRSGGNPADVIAVRDFTATQMSDVAAMTTGADTATNDLLLDAADTLADIDQQARTLCGTCGPEQGVTPPQALSAAAAAASMDNLIARPVAQAQADITAAQAARLKALQGQAQTSAGKIPQVTPGVGTPTASGVTGVAGSSSGPGDSLKSTITSSGQLLPTTISSGAAVKDLVSGVTGTVDQATGGATAPVTQPLDDTVNKLGDTVGGTLDGTTGQLLP